MLDEIIKGCRQRQRKSQKELYEMFYGYGMSITLRYSSNREAGVTILNDAFMKIFDNIRQYNPNRPFRPWIRRIIINTAIDHYHKNEKLRAISGLNNEADIMSEQETILSGISYQEIVAMLNKLTPAYRTVFNLYVIEGFTHEEIAGMLNISVGTSKSNLAKARRNLRTILEKNLK